MSISDSFSAFSAPIRTSTPPQLLDTSMILKGILDNLNGSLLQPSLLSTNTLLSTQLLLQQLQSQELSALNHPTFTSAPPIHNTLLGAFLTSNMMPFELKDPTIA